MKRLIGIFGNLNDAKTAIGKIKVAVWNRAKITVIYPETIHNNKSNNNYEFGSENFITSNTIPSLNWSSLTEQEVKGVGKIKIATIDQAINLNDLKFLHHVLKEQKVSVIIEAVPNVVNEVRYLLEDHGANIMIAKMGEKTSV